jgi:hypothetical protein
MNQNQPNENNLKCQWCGEGQFDLAGLKSHYECGDCEEYNKTENVARPFHAMIEVDKSQQIKKLEAEVEMLRLGAGELEGLLNKCGEYFEFLKSTGTELPEWVWQLSVGNKPPLPEVIGALLEFLYAPCSVALTHRNNLKRCMEQLFEVKNDTHS